MKEKKKHESIVRRNTLKGRRNLRECEFTEMKRIECNRKYQMISNVKYCLKLGKVKTEIPVGLSKCLSKNISQNI